ncbi:hypothetical protein Droror1_Dr00021940 [Drosera rotundifolia]
MDEAQCQYLAGMLMHPMSQTKSSKESVSLSTPLRSDDPRMDEDAVIMESKISQIRDLFPEYDKGYLSVCLEVYNHDPEEVIQRILEGTLHEDLSKEKKIHNINSFLQCAHLQCSNNAYKARLAVT